MPGNHESAALKVARLVSEDLAVAIDLPVGWELDFDEDNDELVAVGSDTRYCVRDVCPTITVKRVPFAGTDADFARLARGALEDMPQSYKDFELKWSEEASEGRASRCYSFVLKQVGQVVTQLQGLLEADNDAAVFVVNCSAPEDTYDALDALFRHAFASLESLGPDYVAPDDDDEEDDDDDADDA